MLADLQQHAFMHLAFLVGVVALIFRDQLHLRAVLVGSVALSILYHATSQSGPMWDDLFWNVVTMLTNVLVLTRIVLDRTHVGLTAEEERLFQAFGSLTPGEFRKLVKLAHWETAADYTVLTHETVRPDRLYFVLDGCITLEKANRRSTLAAPIFVGEVAYIKNRGASATVIVSPGARYIFWSTAALNSTFARQHSLRTALLRLISADMAAKVAIAQA